MNKHRGEVSFAGYTLKPTNAALQEIEDKLDMGLIQLALTIGENNYRIRHIATAIHETAKAGGSNDDYEMVCNAVMDEGLMKASVIVGGMLTNCLAGGKKKAAARRQPEKGSTG